MKYDEPISSMRAVIHADWPIDLPVFTFEHAKSRLVSIFSLVIWMQPIREIPADAYDTHCLR
jgi:hypothetical protein